MTNASSLVMMFMVNSCSSKPELWGLASVHATQEPRMTNASSLVRMFIVNNCSSKTESCVLAFAPKKVKNFYKLQPANNTATLNAV